MKRNLSSFYHIGQLQEFLIIFCPRLLLKKFTQEKIIIYPIKKTKYSKGFFEVS